MANERKELEFDTAAFMADIRAALGEKHALRDMEDATGVSISVFSRIDNGRAMDMDTLLIVCAKLELDPCRYFKRVLWRRVED